MQKHKHAEFIKAWADGAEIEFNTGDDEWEAIDNPSWKDYHTYRIKTKQTFHCGQRFVNARVNVFILAQIAYGIVALINLQDGSRWDNGKPVEDSKKISEEEFKKITGDSEFTLIKE